MNAFLKRLLDLTSVDPDKCDGLKIMNSNSFLQIDWASNLEIWTFG